MTQHSSAELDPAEPTAADLPLSERPLVADNDKTVVASATDNPPDTGMQVALTSTAQEIRDRLFGAGDTGETSEEGLQIGHFEIVERIGTGGMGAVFKAMDKTLARPVALKVLYPGTSGDPSLLARFRQEARAAAQLNHDNIARVFFSDEHDGIQFIAYEYADGRNLKQLITDKGTLSVEETVNYAIQATLALNHINGSNIVHRDIKPSNIIVTRHGRVKVVDLGLARRDTQDSIGDLTVAGTTLGTFDYISPEQARDPSSADIRSDVYSLGCTMYHMLTGQPPYPEGTALQKLLDHQGKTPPDPRTVSADVPASVAFVTQKMMNTDPGQRYQEPGQLLADLVSLAAELGLKTVPAEGVVWRRVPVRQFRQLSGAVFLSISIIAICLTALVMSFRSLPESPPPSVANAPFPTSMYPVGVEAESNVTDNDQSNGSSETAGPSGSDEGNSELLPEIPPPPSTTLDLFGLHRADAEEVEYFGTFREAWSSAHTGDVILLNFDGLPAEPITELSQTPVSTHIEIRAADHQKKPTLWFRLDASTTDIGRLFSLKNGLSLNISDVNVKVDLGSNVHHDQTTLFRCVGESRVSLRRCAIDITNPMRHRFAIVQMTDALPGSSPTPEASCSLENVVIRGCCDVVVNSSQMPVRIETRESAFLLDGSIVYQQGSSDSTSPPGPTDVILDRTSTVSADAVIRMADNDSLVRENSEATLPLLNITAISSVFMSLRPNGCLVESSSSILHVEELEDLFRWNGSHNHYYNFLPYWRISSELDPERTPRSFEQWTQLWERMTETAEDNAVELPEVVLKSPESLKDKTPNDISDIQTESLALKSTPFYSNDQFPELNTDDAGRIPGAPHQQLPSLGE